MPYVHMRRDRVIVFTDGGLGVWSILGIGVYNLTSCFVLVGSGVAFICPV